VSRLPIPNSDDDVWGSILNDFLSQSLNGDGSLKTVPISHGGTGATDAATARSNLGIAPGSTALYIQNAAPSSPPATYLWIQTGLGLSGTDMTFWVEDGS
jgi:hypothetical protein